jgi:hypothetical protein
LYHKIAPVKPVIHAQGYSPAAASAPKPKKPAFARIDSVAVSSPAEGAGIRGPYCPSFLLLSSPLLSLSLPCLTCLVYMLGWCNLGLQPGDEVIEFGTVSKDNFRSMQDVGNVVSNSVGMLQNFGYVDSLLRAENEVFERNGLSMASERRLGSISHQSIIQSRFLQVSPLMLSSGASHVKKSAL